MIKLIVAFDENRSIGKGDTIPWHLPEDMKNFKTKTEGCPVVMGRKTWESLPEKFRPLPKRTNIIISRQLELPGPKPHHLVASVASAVQLANSLNDTTWIIGGAEIYKQALEMNLVDEMLISHVAGTHDGDVFFPEINHDKWKVKEESEHNGFTLKRWVKTNVAD